MASYGPMKTLLGVPILLGERVVGNLYLTEPISRDNFTRRDLEALNILAARAAQAIDRSRLFAEARENQRHAEEQRDQLEVILNSIGSAIFIQNSKAGDVELVNSSARALLIDDSERERFRHPHEGRDYQMLDAGGEPLARHRWPAARAWRGEMVRNASHTFVTPGGRKLPVLAHAAPLRDRLGVIRRVVVVFQDITQLREAEQLKDDFLSLVSHELRTPLTTIHGGAHLLLTHEDILDRETRRDILSDLVLENDRLDQTLSNLLELTAIQAGQTKPEIEPVLLPLLVKQHMDKFASRHHEYTFTHESPEGLPPRRRKSAAARSRAPKPVRKCGEVLIPA